MDWNEIQNFYQILFLSFIVCNDYPLANLSLFSEVPLYLKLDD
jgi:hypothetical protein